MRAATPSSVPGRSTTTSAPAPVVALAERRDGPAHDRARAALGDGEDAPAPAVLRRHMGMRATTTQTPSASRSRPISVGARDDVLAVAQLATHDRPQEAAERLLRGALGRADALDLRGDRASSPGAAAPAAGSPRERIRRAPTGSSATRRSIVSTPAARP